MPLLRCEHFAKYGEKGHELSYFRGNANIPSAIWTRSGYYYLTSYDAMYLLWIQILAALHLSMDQLHMCVLSGIKEVQTVQIVLP